MVDQQTINIPQLLLVLLLSGLAIRYFFFGGRSPSRRISPAANSANNLRAREADVERIQQMFPQLARRAIMWDLQRNGGNVAATTERILSGRGLENPPQTFQPPLPVPASVAASGSSKTALTKPSQPDLITRYNLASKITSGEVDSDVSSSNNASTTSTPRGKQQAWSQNKSERQALLQKRREEMILEARRKMLAKLAAETDSGSGAQT